MRRVLLRWQAVFGSGILVMLTVTFLGSSAQAQSSAPILNPANEHFYEAVTVSGGIDWFDARDAAELQSFWGVQGHLVTITSAQEDNFIATNFPEAFPVIPSPRPPGCEVPTDVENTCGYPYWFGGFQPLGNPPDEPEEDWEWVTGEPFDYTNWAVGEPNDFRPDEDCLDPHPDGSQWNDSSCNDRRIGGYVVEYDISILTVSIQNAKTKCGADGQDQIRISGTVEGFDPSADLSLEIDSEPTGTFGPFGPLTIPAGTRGPVEVDGGKVKVTLPEDGTGEFKINADAIGLNDCTGDETEAKLILHLNGAVDAITLERETDSKFRSKGIVPNGFIVGSVVGDFFWVSEFTVGATLNMFIFPSDDTSVDPLWQGSAEDFDGGIVNIGSEIHGQDLMPGNVIVVSDGQVEESLILELITMEVFDLDLDYMAGTAPPNRFVNVVAGFGPDPTEQHTIETASDDTGAWMADFAGVADIEEDWRPWSFASIFDEDGDSNEAGAPSSPPSPRVTVFPEYEAVELWDWPIGSSVHLAIDDPGSPEEPDFEDDYIMGVADWDPNQSNLWVDIPDPYDIQPDDVVTATDGTTARTYMVQNMAITALDAGADTVMGTADPDTEIQVWVHGMDGSDLQVTAAADGAWTADFNSIGIDLVEGMCGRSETRDEIGNATAVDWCVANPRVTVFPEYEAVELWDWPIGASVHLAIDDPGSPEELDFKDDYIIGVADWDPNQSYLWVDIPDPYDIQPDDVVTATDGTTARTYMVQNMAITALDAGADTVMGTADPDTEIQVWVHGMDGSDLQVTAAADGAWTADFNSIGIDLVEGMCGRSETRDEIGNATAIDWCVFNPHFTAFPLWELLQGWDWPIGSAGEIVYVEIDDTLTGPEPDFAVEATIVPTPWDPNQIWIEVSTGAYDLKPGDIVTLTHRGMSMEHNVRELAITLIDAEQDLVAGTGPTGETVSLLPHNVGDFEPLQADVVGGIWEIDFTGIFDLVEGMDGRAEIFDEAGNSTAVDWHIDPPT